MVSGSAALLLDGFKTNQKSNGGGNANGLALSPGETKALLMNNADTNIDIDPFSGLAEITASAVARSGSTRQSRPRLRLGTPKLRKRRSASACTKSMGSRPLPAPCRCTTTRTNRITYSITPTFRFAGDASGAVVPSGAGFGNDQSRIRE